MHIVFMIIGALAAVGAIIWRIQVAMHAAREIGDLAKTAANLPRKLAFRRKTGQRGSRLVSDPREAAVILMLEVARANGDVSREHKIAISDMLTEHFQFSDAEADEITAQASWVSQDEAGTDGLVRRMTKLITGSVSHDEILQLEQMMVHVAEAEGEPGPEQINVIQRYRIAAGL